MSKNNESSRGRDIMILIGILMIGAGLWMFVPWVSMTVTGLIIAISGLMKS